MSPNKYKEFISEFPYNTLLKDEPLKKHTYFKVGGNADLFCTVRSIDELETVIKLAIKHNIKYFILGGGSNILVPDEGYRGLIVKNKTGNIQLKGFSGGSIDKGKLSINKVLIQADSGVPANQLIRYSINEGYQGLEDFLGLPGTVGGAIFNNSHHIGKLIGDLVVEVEVLDRKGNRKKYTNKDMKFGYDYSILHETKETILTATFQLSKGNKEELWKKAESAVKRRVSTQPLNKPSSGCIFRNIPLSDAIKLGTPNHTCSAGYLIDKAGLKGLTVGDAEVSDIHANFIVNNGNATAEDILQLISMIKEKVKEKFGVDLEMEVFILK